MKIIFSKSFLSQLLRKDTIIKLTKYFFVKSGTRSFSTIEEISSEEVIQSYRTGQRTTDKEIEGLWESDDKILRLFIDIPLSESFNIDNQVLEFNLGYFYYKDIFGSKEEVAFILVPTNIRINPQRNELILEEEDSLELCLGNNLINISDIPSVNCFLEVPESEDTEFLEETGNNIVRNIYISPLEDSLISLSSYKKYLLSNTELKKYPGVDQFINSKGEIIENSYTFKKITGITLRTPGVLISTAGTYFDVIGEKGGTISLVGEYTWEEYLSYGLVNISLGTGTSLLDDLKSGWIEVTSDENKMIESIDFSSKTLTIKKGQEGTRNISIIQIRYLGLEGEDISSNPLMIKQEGDVFLWECLTIPEWKENSLPLYMTPGEKDSTFEIVFTSNLDFSLEEDVYYEVSEYADWAKWFNFSFSKGISSGSDFSLTLTITSLLSNPFPENWCPAVENKGVITSYIPKVRLRLCDVYVYEFYLIQKPIKPEIKLWKRNSDSISYSEVNTIILGKGIMESSLYPTILSGSGIGYWSLGTRYTEEYSPGKKYINVSPLQGPLSTQNQSGEIFINNSGMVRIYTDFVNNSTKDYKFNDFILYGTTSPGSSQIIDLENWRDMVRLNIVKVPCLIEGEDPYVKITVSNSSEPKVIEGFEVFDVNVKSNCGFKLEPRSENSFCYDISFLDGTKIKESQEYDVKSGINFKVKVNSLNYDYRTNIQGTGMNILIGNLIATCLEFPSVFQSSELYVRSRQPIFTRDNLMFPENDYGIFLNPGNNNYGMEINSPFRSLSGYFEASENYEDYRLNFLRPSSGAENCFFNQEVVYNSSGVFKDIKGTLNYDIEKLNEEDCKYPISPVGFLVVGNSGSTGSLNTEFSSVYRVRIPVFIIGQAPKVTRARGYSDSLLLPNIPTSEKFTYRFKSIYTISVDNIVSDDGGNFYNYELSYLSETDEYELRVNPKKENKENKLVKVGTLKITSSLRLRSEFINTGEENQEATNYIKSGEFDETVASRIAPPSTLEVYIYQLPNEAPREDITLLGDMTDMSPRGGSRTYNYTCPDRYKFEVMSSSECTYEIFRSMKTLEINVPPILESENYEHLSNIPLTPSMRDTFRTLRNDRRVHLYCTFTDDKSTEPVTDDDFVTRLVEFNELGYRYALIFSSNYSPYEKDMIYVPFAKDDITIEIPYDCSDLRVCLGLVEISPSGEFGYGYRKELTLVAGPECEIEEVGPDNIPEITTDHICENNSLLFLPEKNLSVTPIERIYKFEQLIDKINYSINIHIIQGCPEYTYEFCEGFEDECCLKFGSDGYCLDGYKYTTKESEESGLPIVAPGTLLPTLRTNLPKEDLSAFLILGEEKIIPIELGFIKIMTETDNDTSEEEEGGNEEVSDLLKFDTYRVLAEIPENNGTDFIGMDEEAPVKMIINSEILGETIWTSDIIQGFITIGVRNPITNEVVYGGGQISTFENPIEYPGEIKNNIVLPLRDDLEQLLYIQKEIDIESIEIGKREFEILESSRTEYMSNIFLRKDTSLGNLNPTWVITDLEGNQDTELSAILLLYNIVLVDEEGVMTSIDEPIPYVYNTFRLRDNDSPFMFNITFNLYAKKTIKTLIKGESNNLEFSLWFKQLPIEEEEEPDPNPDPDPEEPDPNDPKPNPGDDEEEDGEGGNEEGGNEGENPNPNPSEGEEGEGDGEEENPDPKPEEPEPNPGEEEEGEEKPDPDDPDPEEGDEESGGEIPKNEDENNEEGENNDKESENIGT